MNLHNDENKEINKKKPYIFSYNIIKFVLIYIISNEKIR